MFLNKIFSFNVLKGILISLIFTAISILIFAYVLYLFSIPNEVIKPINYLIKVLAVFIGCYFSVSGEKGLLKGCLYGAIITIISFLFFSLLSGRFILDITFLWDLLLGVVVGGIGGIVAVNRKINL